MIGDTRATSDERLAVLARANKDFFGMLVERYQDRLARYLRRMSGLVGDEAEDVLQEIFIKVYLNLAGFDEQLTFSSWIYRIAHNHMIDTHRKKMSRPQLVVDGDELLILVPGNDDVVQKADRGILREVIATSLQALPDKYREVLTLKFLEELSYQEISDILKKPVGTVGTLVNRAKHQLQEVFKTQYRNYHHEH